MWSNSGSDISYEFPLQLSRSSMQSANQNDIPGHTLATAAATKHLTARRVAKLGAAIPAITHSNCRQYSVAEGRESFHVPLPDRSRDTGIRTRACEVDTASLDRSQHRCTWPVTSLLHTFDTRGHGHIAKMASFIQRDSRLMAHTRVQLIQRHKKCQRHWTPANACLRHSSPHTSPPHS